MRVPLDYQRYFVIWMRAHGYSEETIKTYRTTILYDFEDIIRSRYARKRYITVMKTFFRFLDEFER